MKHGFSLVELSIVLVILGLLTGGILAGQSLIRAAELRSVSTEFDRYMAATQTFRDKYFALPGDMNNAQKFWGSAAVCPGDHTNPSTTATTCNGNGDGTIVNAGTSNEPFRYWQHLANAGLIEGTYIGVSGNATGSNSAIPGTNIPRSKINNAGWTAYYRVPTFAGSTEEYAGPNGNLYQFGGTRSTGISIEPVLKPEEAWNIDTKADDGMPGRGKIIASMWDNCTTSGSETDLAGAYALTTTSNQCSLQFVRLF
jgi:prepilin-type N-terminal cleavage/methylation domain-containing protein